MNPTAVLEIARQTLKLQARSKLFWLLIGLAVMFACAFTVLPLRAHRMRGDVLYEVVAYGSGFVIGIPFVCLYLAVLAVSGDIEDRSSVYLFTRPLARPVILLGKWLAVCGLGVGYGAVALTALYLVVRFGNRPWAGGALPSLHTLGTMLATVCIAVVGYASVGCLLAAFFRRPMLVSMIYIVTQEAVSRLSPKAGLHALTVADPVRRFLDASLPATADLHEMLTARFSSGAEERAVLDSLGSPIWAWGKL
ncbi:MAG: ABC transporter permease subunit, partial [Planctomycetes bacterium]|nr:ABC transporter permease subunit [Planctomycetota bacterium]